MAVGSGQIVLRGEGSTLSRLFFTQSQGMSFGGHITFGSNPSYDAPLPLAQDGAEYALEVYVEDASSLAVGDDVALGNYFFIKSKSATTVASTPVLMEGSGAILKKGEW